MPAAETSTLASLLKIILCAIPFAMALLRLGQSPIVGFLLAGLLIGPGGLALIPAEATHDLSEIGVGLLLFTIGIELSLSRVVDLRRIAFGGGTLQVAGTAAVAALVIAAITGRALEAVYVGCALALSSSAIILKTLADKGDLDAPYAGPVTAVAIFQDLATVPMMVVLPALGAGGAAAVAGAAGAVEPSLAWRVGAAMAKAGALLGVLYLGSRFLIDRLLFAVARSRSPEVFVLTVAALILAAAWGSQLAGLPLALGAFIAGILLADSEYASQILADVNPMKGLFQAIFFVSIGMLLDPRVVLERPVAVLLAVAIVIVAKALIAAFALRAAGVAPSVAVAGGIVLAQVGEFSFVVVTIGERSGLISDDVYQLTLAASFASMAVAPPLIANVRRILGLLSRAPRVGQRLAGGADDALAKHAKELSGHIVIGGFGPVGRDVATFLLDHGIEFVAIELNPKTVKDLSSAGIPIFFGDFSNPTVLEEAGIERARALVVAAPDIAAVRRAVGIARAKNAALTIVARTKYRATVPAVLAAGANEVIEEEFETAIEMVARLTRVLGLSRDAVVDHIAGQRLERYTLGGGTSDGSDSGRGEGAAEGSAPLDESQSMASLKAHAKDHPPKAH